MKLVSYRGHGDPPETLTTSGFHFNTAAVVVASLAVPALLLTGDQQMLIRKIDGGRERWIFFRDV